MYLKRLEIQGFKSFAKKTVLEFERGITAIVGPNGSGKSNVADCLRWVLGEQSAKLMRGKKSDDVIFAGSDKKVKLGFAEVVATFDNRDHKIPVDASEVSIGRRIDRSGDSQYLLNGAVVRLLDIVDLVLKSNIGTSRYTVIGQGTIDQMVLAGPGEVKHLLDEASGVKTYYIRREKTLKRLEQTAQNLMRVQDVMNELEPRLKSLRRQAKRMEARSEVETELKTYQQAWFGQQYWQLEAARTAVTQRLEQVVGQRQQHEQQKTAVRQKIDALEKDNQNEVGRYKQLQQQLQVLQQEKNQLLEQASMIRGTMQSQKTVAAGDPRALEIQAHALTSRIRDVAGKLATADQQLEQLDHQVLGKESALAEVNQKLGQLYERLAKPVELRWDDFTDQLGQFEQAFDQFLASMATASELEAVKFQAARLQERLMEFSGRARTIIEDPTRAQALLQQELQSLVRSKDELAQVFAGLQAERSKLTASKELWQQQLASFEQEKRSLDLSLKQATSVTADAFWQDLVQEETQVVGQLEVLGKTIGELETQLRTFYDVQETWKQQLTDLDLRYRQAESLVSQVKDQESIIQIEKAKIDTQQEALVAEGSAVLGHHAWAEVVRQKFSHAAPDLTEKITKLKHQLDMIGGVDDLTIKEYQETEQRYTHLLSQVTDLQKGVADLREIIDELDGHIKTKFNEAFHKINAQFEQYFRVLFNGGRAYLSMVRATDDLEVIATDDPELEHLESAELAVRPEERMLAKYEKANTNIIGVDIKATPPGKKLATIQALSGGERALTSIALLCSLLACFPSPFVVLDEVDAALDEANTIRFGQILGTLAHQTQFITITHNRETMAQSNTLYGVTMGDDGISKLLSIKLEQAKAFAK
jgi:chromosome segregation protein